MEIQSSRFGRLVVEDDRLVTFPHGLLGFPEMARFTVVQIGTDDNFQWLQSTDDPNLAFVVTNPSLFFREYDVPLREESHRDLQIASEADVQVLVICNKVGDWLTGNLLGPILLNRENRLAQQIVLTEKKWTTRQPLVKLPIATAAIPLARSA